MPKKKSYDAYVRQQMGDLIDQLQLSRLEKQSLKERWLDQMIWADKKAGSSRRAYYRLRLTTVVGGVILPALVGISLQLGQNSKFFRVWFPPLTFALSQVIAVSVALEEFCKFGDRWRDYRKMAEDLKSEGWQYLQSSGSYAVSDPLEQNFAHERYFAQFSNRVESIIKNDVESYISNLMQQQAKHDVEAQKILAQAQAVGSRKHLNGQTLNEPLQADVPALSPSTDNTAPSNGNYSALSPSTDNTALSNGNYSATASEEPLVASDAYLKTPISTPGNGQPPQSLPAPVTPPQVPPSAPQPAPMQAAADVPALSPSTDNTAPSNGNYSALFPSTDNTAPSNGNYSATASEEPLAASDAYLKTPISTPGNGQPPQSLPAPVTPPQVPPSAPQPAPMQAAADVPALSPSTDNTAPSNGNYSATASEEPLAASDAYLKTPISTPGNGQPPQSLPAPVTPPQVPPSAPQPAPMQAAADLNAAILAAALKLKDMSTSDGPDGGNQACAWTVNRVLHEANIPPLGDNPNYVPAVLDALKSGRGQLVPPHAAKAGDLVIAAGEAHIGISLDDRCQRVLSNSSSRARFCWESDVNYDGCYSGSSTIYRLLK